ncbi:hypothetical protein ACF07S_10110 [Streptomyces sp. NPDC016640]|uniref:hypothetical protein n=1 Tax=Streptomyces sp. NPDC016640 TaxID=3364969 RepID=UPI0036FBFF34
MNIEAVLVSLLSVSHTPEQAEHAARTVLRDHAHQLAEQQRQAHDRSSYHMGLSCKPEYDCGVAKMINLIDPGATR